VLIQLPHTVIYGLRDRPDADLIAASIISNRQLVTEAAAFLEATLDGLTIEGVKVEVRRISQESPLTEAFVAAIILTFQPKLERDVPRIIEGFTGFQVPEEYHAILSLVVCALALYGARAAIDFLKGDKGEAVQARLTEITSDVAVALDVPEDKIRRVLETRYRSRKRVSLIRSAVSFFRPAKQAPGSDMIIGEKVRIEPRLIANVPDLAMLENVAPQEKSESLEKVEIHLVAQDEMRQKSGWAGIIPAVSDERLRMQIMPPLRPEQVYLNKVIRADVIVMSREQPEGSYKPYMFFLIRLRDEREAA
jgi:hypothetical protein